jgi:hypothetical protein
VVEEAVDQQLTERFVVDAVELLEVDILFSHLLHGGLLFFPSPSGAAAAGVFRCSLIGTV